MDQNYWIGRRRASAANARGAASSEARLVHLDLAGRYSVLAAAAGRNGEASPARPPEGRVMPDAAYYERLETGARWLASRAVAEADRSEHLGMAGKYARLRLEAAAAGRR